jgi:hypothetical protein
MNTTQPKQASATTGRMRWTRRAGPLAAAVLAIGLIAGCGGGSSSSGTTAQNRSASSKAGQGVRFAQCMRAHGVTNFPDPTSSGAITFSKTAAESPQFQTAQQACRSLAPVGSQSGGSVSPEMQAQALRFAHCVRSHGVPDFPDPSFTGGGVGIAIPPSLHNSPALSAARQACSSLTPAGGGS